jgi:hypothetical protein
VGVGVSVGTEVAVGEGVIVGVLVAMTMGVGVEITRATIVGTSGRGLLAHAASIKVDTRAKPNVLPIFRRSMLPMSFKALPLYSQTARPAGT